MKDEFNEKSESYQNKFINYHCKNCKEIPLLNFSNDYLDIICSQHKVLNVPIDKFYDFIIFDYECSICTKIFEENNLFYCYECNKNYCDKCKIIHKKDIQSHFLVNANEKNTLCKLHNKIYDKYCIKCKLNLCELCNNHSSHYIEKFNDIYPLEEDIKKFNQEALFILDLIQVKENTIKNTIKEIEQKEKEEKEKEEKDKEEIEKVKNEEIKNEEIKNEDIKNEDIKNDDMKDKGIKSKDEDIKKEDENIKNKEESEDINNVNINNLLNEEGNQNNLNEEESQNNSQLSSDTSGSHFFDEENQDYSYLKQLNQKKLDNLNKQRKIIKIKNLLVNSFFKTISNFSYINNVNNIVRTTFKNKFNFIDIKRDINYKDDIPKNDDPNNIENKILIKSLTEEENKYYSIWCMKKLNDIKIDLNQKLELIALGDSNYRILIINLLTFKFYQIIKEHEGTVYSLEQYIDDSNFLFSSSDDGTINIYKLDENYKYKLIQKLKKATDKEGSEINKVISLSNKLLVSGDHRSITIWKSNPNQNNEINYEDFYEIIINKDTCHLLEVNPLIFVATQYTNHNFQVYKNDGNNFPLIGELNAQTHGHSSNGLAKINNNTICSGGFGLFYVISIEPLQIIQKYTQDINIYFLYITKDNYLYLNGKNCILQYKILNDEDNNCIELMKIGEYIEDNFNEKSIVPLDDGKIFFMNANKYFHLIA